MNLLETLKKFRSKFGTPWILWVIFLSWAILTNQGGDLSSVSDKIKTLVIGLVLLAYIPWKMRQLGRRRKAKRKAKRKAELEALKLRAQSLTGGAKVWYRVQKFTGYLLIPAIIYALYKVLRNFIPELSKYANAQPYTESNDLAGIFKFIAKIWPGIWDIFVRTYTHTGAGQFLLAFMALAIVLRIVNFVKKKRNALLADS